VIVTCPGCSTHYSHAQEDTPQIGRCSQCDERFALSGLKRRYVVRPAVASGPPADPLLVAALAETETLVDRPAEVSAFPTLSGSMEIPDFPIEGAERIGDEDDGFFSSSLDEEALFGIERATDADVDPQKAAADEPAVHRPAHPIREALGVFLLAGLGGAAGFHGSLRFGIEPLKAICLGLGLGLTFGWAWIRWAERKR
jgi:hypothetical protein